VAASWTSPTELLDGEPPNDEDEFALEHWRKKGYIN
jgi:hypothetical protein